MSGKNKDRNQHIKVFTRVRPRSALEVRSQVIVDCINNKEVAIKDKGQTKTFSFDKIFGPDSKQLEIYKAVVGPLISEVLQGYNCTVFAYGQTGTGKTFTMIGDRSPNCVNWQDDPLCGIIPRTLDHLFDELKVRAEEYTVRVSFLELYNEELFDLLAPACSDDTKTLRLFEDSMKKGSVIVSGLEERTVQEKNDVYPILEAGSIRRQTAPTLMNASSSRSHTIFTITVHVKVTTPDGEELFKTGKLNLVDLAGSENIGRSGAVDARAREAGSINQSLLTLGRVITSLVERTPHVPYRESKLTRILQDSLGGRTKTSIIATVSPALCNLEETLSTLDYAHRARHITNKPEINQKTSKPVLLKNYTDEIERLRRELMATREKHGIYLHNDDYTGMLNQIDNLNKELVNKITLLKVREEELMKIEDVMASLNVNLCETKSDLDHHMDMLRIKEAALQEREKALQVLNEQAQVLLVTADEATDDSKRLHDRLDRARMVHSRNQEVIEAFKARLGNSISVMKAATEAFRNRCLKQMESLKDSTNREAIERQKSTEEVFSLTTGFSNEALTEVFNVLDPLLDQMDETKQSLSNQKKQSHTLEKDLSALSKEVSGRIETWQRDGDEEGRMLLTEIEDSLKKLVDLSLIISGSKTSLNKGEEAINSIPANCTATKERKHLEELEAKKVENSTLLASCRKKQNELLKELLRLREEEAETVSKMETLENELAVQRHLVEEVEIGNLKSQLAHVSLHFDSLSSSLTKSGELNSLLRASVEKLLPCVMDNQAKDKDGKEKFKLFISEELLKSVQSCLHQCKEQAQQIDSLTSKFIAGAKGKDTSMKMMTDFQKKFDEIIKKEKNRLAEASESLLTAQTQLAKEINDYCEETFVNYHGRCKELKDQELLRDEKTGQTPQRKDFNYPRHLLPVENLIEDIENVPPT